jgi:hypothetical protein
MRIGTNFWNLDWGIWDDIFRPDADFTPESNPWRPEFLQEVHAYEGCGSWSPEAPGLRVDDRSVQPARPGHVGHGPAPGRRGLRRPMATLIHRQFRPDLRVYVEWSNETWNSDFA